jgi:dienelactone hydrolase
MRTFASFAALLALVTACGSDSSSGDDTPTIDADPDAPDADPSAPDASTTLTDPGSLGDFGVHEQTANVTTSLGTVGVTVYSPSTDGGASPAAGPFPLVVVSTGFSIGRGNYDKTCEHLASWGYVVLSHDYANTGNHDEKAAEIGDLLDWALGSASGVAARIDAAKIATAGHSLGGKVSIFAAILDDRIKAVVGWDPVDALPPFGNDGSSSVTPERIDELAVPLAVIGETTDAGGGLGMACAPSADNYTQYFDYACGAPDLLEVTVANADHTDWVDDRQACGFACFACQTGSTADATVLQISRRMTVAWLELQLRDNAGAAQWLMAPGLGSPTTVRTDPASCP